jgi:hypothetical protein
MGLILDYWKVCHVQKNRNQSGAGVSVIRAGEGGVIGGNDIPSISRHVWTQTSRYYNAGPAYPGGNEATSTRNQRAIEKKQFGHIRGLTYVTLSATIKSQYKSGSFKCGNTCTTLTQPTGLGGGRAEKIIPAPNHAPWWESIGAVCFNAGI